MDKQTDVQRLAKVLANAEPVKVEIPAFHALILCGLLEMTLRHPAISPDTASYKVARWMIEHLQEFLQGVDPYLGQVVEQSKDPGNDLSIFESGGFQNFG